MGLNFLRQFRSESDKSLGGRYQIVQQLGAGGFGQTFIARDLHLPGHPTCVVKQLKPQVNSSQELQVARRLFDTEAQALYQLGSHPQVPRLLAHFEDNQEFYLAQELIEGHALDQELATATPWSDSQVIGFLSDILETLAFVHGHQVIHRDLKPSNLIRRHSDNRIVLIDFGAVKQVSTQMSASTANISHTISIGTRGYMPNEQIAGRPQFSSDVYAVGVIAIQALTGQHPQGIQLHPQTGELDWHGLAPQSHPNLIALLDYMVRYDFRSRYATAAEALAALRAAFPEFVETSRAASPTVSPAPSPNRGQAVPNAYPHPNPAVPPESEPRNLPPRSPQPSPSMAVPTVAVGGRPTETEMTGYTHMPYAAPGNTPPQSSRKLTLPLVIGGAIFLGLGLVTWRACTPSPPVETVDSSPEAPVSDASQSPEPELTIPAPTVEPAELPQEEANPEPDPTPAPSETTAPPSQPIEAPIEAPEPEPELAPAPALTSTVAQTTVGTLYNHVSNQSWDDARALFGGGLAQQFDPNFFRQFQRVTVENLRVTNQTDQTVELIGQNTYVYPDGSTQREERTYTVQMVNDQPRIVASSFVRVTQSRRN